MTIEELRLRVEAAFPGAVLHKERPPLPAYTLTADFHEPVVVPGFPPVRRLWFRANLGPYGVRAYRESPETGNLVQVPGPIRIEIERRILSVSAHALIAARRRLALADAQ